MLQAKPWGIHTLTDFLWSIVTFFQLFFRRYCFCVVKKLKNRRFKIIDVLLALGSNRIHFSLIDPSSTGKGEGWTSPQYRNTGGRGPPPNGGPRRWRSSPGFVFFCVRQSNAIQANGWLWRWAGWRFPTPRSNGRRMRLRIHCF